MIRLFAITAFLLCTALARADEKLDIRLISEVTSITPGVPFYVGLALHHGPGYHTYWKHPGTVGVPTQITWNSLPAGFKAEPIDWPEPEPVLMFKIKAQGFERDVVLPIRITPPSGLAEGSKVKLNGKAAWMCCARTCHPGFVDLEIELPVRKTEVPAFDAAWHGKFDAERAIRPRTSEAWSASVTSNDKLHTLTLKPQANARPFAAAEAAKVVFFTEDGFIDSDKPQKIECTADGGLRMVLQEADYIIGDRPTRLSGVILCKRGWETSAQISCMRINPPLPQ